jgi:predicted metal-dependent hydrolase
VAAVDAAAAVAAAADDELAGGSPGKPPEDLPDLVLRGIEEFNSGEFFECHEYLEEAWMEESGRVRYLYQGILQVGVGFYHLQNGNWRGATGLLRNGTTRLKEFEPVTLGVDVARLIRESERCLQELEERGRGQLDEFDHSTIPKVHWAE